MMLGKTLGHHRIVEQLGQGGMGLVYRAHDEVLDRDVAIKVLPGGTLADEAARKRFRKEALALSKLNHAHIETIHDFGTQDGVDFLVMEYVPGVTLALKLATGPLHENEVLALGAEIASALEESHQQGIVHRDLKPTNIVVTPKGHAKVLDFGLAKLLRPVSEVTTIDTMSDTSGAVGTLPYMSPEQLRGEPADARTDLYALGAVLYELATGQRPFREDLASRLTDAILHQPTVSPRALNAHVSTELERIILKCLEKERERRYQSAKDVEVDLRRLASPSPAVTSSRAYPTPGHRSKATRIQSLAVLPLTNLAGPGEEYFVDGMTEALITDLAQIGALRVISRTSVMRYKGTCKSLPEIARDLDVDCLIEGSILRAGNQVRITAQLIHAASDTHLWARSYERDLNNILVLQRDVAQAIAEEIRINLTAKQRARLVTRRSVQSEAYEAYLKGRYYWNKRTGQDIEKAIQYFQQAVAIDPDYAPTYAGLADAYHVLWVYTGVAPREMYLQAKTAALKALEIDDNIAEAHTSLAAIKADDEWDFPGAEAEFRKAILLNPNYPTAHQWFAQYLAYVGRFEEAVAEIRKAQQLDPLSPIIHTVSGDTYLRARQYDQAIAQLKEAIEIDPNFSLAHSKLRDVYLEKKMFQEAISEGRAAATLVAESHERAAESTRTLTEAYAKSGEDGYWRKRIDLAMENRERDGVRMYDESSYCIASIYARLGEEVLAFQWLKRAVEERDVSVMYVKTAPEFDRIRPDPRAADLMERIGLRG